jgi:hypothetical protein
MASFGYFKHKKKKSNFHNNILELKVHLESKLILIQQLNEKDWMKLMDI